MIRMWLGVGTSEGSIEAGRRLLDQRTGSPLLHNHAQRVQRAVGHAMLGTHLHGIDRHDVRVVVGGHVVGYVQGQGDVLAVDPLVGRAAEKELGVDLRGLEGDDKVKGIEGGRADRRLLTVLLRATHTAIAAPFFQTLRPVAALPRTNKVSPPTPAAASSCAAVPRTSAHCVMSKTLGAVSSSLYK